LPRHDPSKLTEKEESAARNLVAGLSPTKSCEQAGYADPKGECDRLLGKPRVRDFVIGGLQRHMVRWAQLRMKAMTALDHNLSKENWDQLDRFDKPVISAGDRNTASKIVLELLAKIDPKELADRAHSADEAESLAQKVHRILDSHTSEPQ
jgi:hypothetical protein